MSSELTWLRCCWFIFVFVVYNLTCSFFNFLFSANEDEEKESQNSEQARGTRQLKAKRAFRSERSKSESSARYLSWENVSFLGGEIRKTVARGFHWIAYPSLGKTAMLPQGP